MCIVENDLPASGDLTDAEICVKMFYLLMLKIRAKRKVKISIFHIDEIG